MATGKKSALSTGKRLAIGEVPEVQEYLDIKQQLDALRAENPQVFMVYNDLVDRYNTALERAAATVRGLEVSCGPFENFSVSYTIDPEKMFDELGEKNYLACGGQITKRAVYTVDPAAVDAAIASGKIPEEAVQNFRSKSLKYHVPKKITG